MHWFRWWLFFVFSVMVTKVEDLSLTLANSLPVADMVDWMKEHFPQCNLSAQGMMVSHIAKHLELSETTLCKRVHDAFSKVQLHRMCDDWLLQTHQTREQYAQNIVLKGLPSDALFAMLVAMELEINVTIATIQGLWSTKQDMQPTTDDDVFLVFMDSGLCWLLFPVEPQCVEVHLQTPCPDWSTVPPILNAPVLMVS